MLATQLGRRVLAFLIATLALALPVSAQPIPNAPEEILYMYLQSLNLTVEDSAVLDEWESNFMGADYQQVQDNIIKRAALRQRALEQIQQHHVSRRVALGLPVVVGDYDLAKHQFPLLYPVFPLGIKSDLYGRPPVVSHQIHAPALGEGPRSGAVQNGYQADCTMCPDTNYFSPIKADSHFDVQAMCTERPMPHPQWPNVINGFYITTNLIPTTFRLALTHGVDWNFLQMDEAKASMLIDRLNGQAGMGLKNTLWAIMVFDVLDMDQTVIKNPQSDEGGPSANHQTVGAVFHAEPRAVFAWAYPPCAPNRASNSGPCFAGRVPQNFIFSMGNLTVPAAPLDGVITNEMISTPVSSTGSRSTGISAPASPREGVGSASSASPSHAGNDVVPRAVPEQPQNGERPSIDFGQSAPR